MIECPACRVKYVDNTLFCTECGLYLREDGRPGTDPLETLQVKWTGQANRSHAAHKHLADTGPLVIRLRIRSRGSSMGRVTGQPGPTPGRSRAPGLASRLPDTGALPRLDPPRLPRGQGDPGREVELPLTSRPIRLGRMDPNQSIYPEIDLTDQLALEAGVSRRHACIYRRGNDVAVEDLGSINGTLLNGKRLAPYIPEPLKDGDQLQLGKLLIEVCLKGLRLPDNTADRFSAYSVAV